MHVQTSLFISCKTTRQLKKQHHKIEVAPLSPNQRCTLEAEMMRNETDSIPDIFLDVQNPASRIHNHNTRFVSNLII